MLASIETAEQSMTRAERKVADFVRADANSILRMSIATLAERVGVSEPTVIRFCRTLGCQGFQEFKLLLAQDIATGARFGQLDLVADESISDLIVKVIDGGIASLIKVRESLPADAVQAAIDLLSAAERIEFYGLGGSGIVATDAQHKFFRLGIPVVAYSDPTIHTVAASLLKPGSVIVAISQAGHTRELLTSVELGLSAGADVIAVTAADSPLAGLATVCLPINVLADEDSYAPIKSRMAHLAIIDILAVGVALRRGPEFQESLARSRTDVHRANSTD